MNIKQALQVASKDRVFLVLAIAMVGVSLILIVITALNIRPNEIQVPVRFSSFSYQRFYTDRWYYLISFAVMGLAMLLLHLLIALKLYIQKGRDLALLFMWLGFSIVAIAAITIFAIFRVVLLFTQ